MWPARWRRRPRIVRPWRCRASAATRATPGCSCIRRSIRRSSVASGSGSSKTICLPTANRPAASQARAVGGPEGVRRRRRVGQGRGQAQVAAGARVQRLHQHAVLDLLGGALPGAALAAGQHRREPLLNALHSGGGGGGVAEQALDLVVQVGLHRGHAGQFIGRGQGVEGAIGAVGAGPAPRRAVLHALHRHGGAFAAGVPGPVAFDRRRQAGERRLAEQGFDRAPAGDHPALHRHRPAAAQAHMRDLRGRHQPAGLRTRRHHARGRSGPPARSRRPRRPRHGSALRRRPASRLAAASRGGGRSARRRPRRCRAWRSCGRCGRTS